MGNIEVNMRRFKEDTSGRRHKELERKHEDVGAKLGGGGAWGAL